MKRAGGNPPAPTAPERRARCAPPALGRRVAAGLAVLLSLAAAAEAAQIERIELDDGGAAILVRGEIAFDDADTFRVVVAGVTQAIVVLESPGGSLFGGIELGKAIRLRGFPTLVLSQSACASSCALAWLAGVPRVMAEDAFVGFHAAFLMDASGAKREVGSGNALVGAYLTNLGLREEAVFALTSAPPDGITRFDRDFSQRYGIPVDIVDATTGAPAQPAPPDAFEGEILADTDIPGADLGRIDRTTFDACRAACGAEPSCRAVTYNERFRVCFLKRAAGARVPYRGARSWVVVGSASPTASSGPDEAAASLAGVDLPGEDLQQHDKVSFSACRTQCVRTSACRALTYNTRFSACFLKRAVPDAVRHPDALSWIRP